jgi:hypothetical protein
MLRDGDVTFSIVSVLLVAGIACGLAGGIFARLVLSGTARLPWLARLQARHPLVFAGACGLAVAGLGLATAGATFGGGYETTRDMLAGTVTTPWYYSIGRFAATLLSTLSGLPGGIFAPSLAVGAGIGADLAPLAPLAVSAAAVTALCMTAYLAAVTNAPLTSFIVVMEMVDGHEMVLSLMAVAMIASLVSRLVSPPLYETLAARMLADCPASVPHGATSRKTLHDLSIAVEWRGERAIWISASPSPNMFRKVGPRRFAYRQWLARPSGRAQARHQVGRRFQARDARCAIDRLRQGHPARQLSSEPVCAVGHRRAVKPKTKLLEGGAGRTPAALTAGEAPAAAAVRKAKGMDPVEK